MELEFKCRVLGCGETFKVEWPEVDAFEGGRMLDNQMRGVTPITIHHNRTRPKNSEGNIAGSGHSSFETILNGKQIHITVTQDYSIVDTDSYKYLDL